MRDPDDESLAKSLDVIFKFVNDFILFIIISLIKKLKLLYIYIIIMTAGGLIQLVTASGEQDIYLTGNPQITLFKSVYRRHTNFSIETIQEVFTGGVGFGRQARCILPKIGDLLSKITLHVKVGSLNPEYNYRLERSKHIPHQSYDRSVIDGLTKNKCACTECLRNQYKKKLIYGWVNALGHALIDSTWIEIGGVRIDKHYGEWMEIWSELTQTEEKINGYYQMIGKIDPKSFKFNSFTGEMELLIPLNFWFCRNIGLALPIMALYYHPVELVVDFRRFEECWISNKKNPKIPKPPMFEANLWLDYIYLDVDERKQFYEESQVYLIEQLQYTNNCPITASNVSVELCFNHPIKELFWVLQRNDVVQKPNGLYPNSNYPIGNDWFNFSTFPCQNHDIEVETFENAVIQFNAIDRFKRIEAKYFRLLQPYYYHTRIPRNYIYVYNFGIRPESIQPTGQMNFSRVDNAKLHITLPNGRDYSKYNLRCYAMNYNIFVVTAGMGGVLFTN